MNSNPRKKKVRNACGPCIKSKLRCDVIRPCTRCVKRGTPELCGPARDFADDVLVLDHLDEIAANYPVKVNEDDFQELRSSSFVESR